MLCFVLQNVIKVFIFFVNNSALSVVEIISQWPVAKQWQSWERLGEAVCAGQYGFFFFYLFIIGQHFGGKGTTVFMLGRVGLKHSGADLVQKLELRHCPLNIRTYPTGICWAWCRIHCFQAIRIHCYSFSLGFCYHFCSFQRVRVGEVHRFPFSIQVGEKCSVGKKKKSKFI